MALSHVELYEALKDRIGEKAAALIAEVVPPARELATKLDLERAVTELTRMIVDLRADLKAEMATGFAQLRTLRWLFGLFLPVWVGTWMTFVVILVKK